AKEGAVRIAISATDLTDDVAGLLSEPEALTDFAAKAREFARHHVGATSKTVSFIDQFLGIERNESENVE
ncbi:MAG: hypothetical protein N2B03_04375, partial [Boseongicola sp.]